MIYPSFSKLRKSACFSTVFSEKHVKTTWRPAVIGALQCTNSCVLTAKTWPGFKGMQMPSCGIQNLPPSQSPTGIIHVIVWMSSEKSRWMCSLEPSFIAIQKKAGPKFRAGLFLYAFLRHCWRWWCALGEVIQEEHQFDGKTYRMLRHTSWGQSWYQALTIFRKMWHFMYWSRSSKWVIVVVFWCRASAVTEGRCIKHSQEPTCKACLEEWGSQERIKYRGFVATKMSKQAMIPHWTEGGINLL